MPQYFAIEWSAETPNLKSTLERLNNDLVRLRAQCDALMSVIHAAHKEHEILTEMVRCGMLKEGE